MMLWDESPREVLEVLLSSTDRKFYISEIADISGLSWPTVSQTLKRLEGVHAVIREDERYVSESEFRAPRVYYSLSPTVIDFFRLPDPD